MDETIFRIHGFFLNNSELHSRQLTRLEMPAEISPAHRKPIITVIKQPTENTYNPTAKRKPKLPKCQNQYAALITA